MKEDIQSILANPFGRFELVDQINDSSTLFQELAGEAMKEGKYNWRAAWILGHCTQKDDPRLIPFASKLVKSIAGKEQGHQRELLKLIVKIDITEDDEGELFDHCVTIWETIGNMPSVRFIAFRIIAKIAKKYTELIDEIQVLSQPQYTETLSPGIKNSFDKILNSVILMKRN